MPYERMIIDGKEYFRCGMCNQIYEDKPENRFVTHYNGRTRYSRHYCKSCKEKYSYRVYSKANGKRRYQEAKKNGTDWYHKNIDLNRKKQRERNGAARAKRYGLTGIVTDEEWERTVAKFDHKCAYCGISGFLEKDHIVPMSRGGENTIQNVVPACRRCNSSKHNSLVGEWYAEQPFFSAERLKKIRRYRKGLDIR